MTDTHRYSVSAAAAVVREDGKVLAIKRQDNGHWEPPGGVLEPGEQIMDALIREVREETGLTVGIERLTGVYQNMARDIIAFVFHCRVQGGELRLSDETQDARWLTATELSEEMDEAYAARLSDALNGDVPVRVRTHDGIRLSRS